MEANRPKVLIVDDVRRGQCSIEQILSDMPAEVVCASSSQEALSHLQRNDFAIVILTGPTTISELIHEQSHLSRVPILYVAPIGCSEEVIQRAYEHGAVDCLVSPYAPLALTRKVETFVEINRQHSELKATVDVLRERQQVLEQRSGEMYRFAHVAAHDLKAPLRRISGFSQILTEDYSDELGAGALDSLERIVGSSRHMTSLVDDLLEYASSGKLDKRFEYLNMVELTEKVLRLLGTEIDDACAKVELGPMPLIYGDQTSIIQVMQNLIANALKFRTDRDPRVNISAAKVGEEWQFSVSDNGIGIDEKSHERIFQTFERLHSQAKYEGSGLGLATCARLVRQHGGRLWVESTLGNGSTFHFTLGMTAPEGQGLVEPSYSSRDEAGAVIIDQVPQAGGYAAAIECHAKKMLQPASARVLENQYDNSRVI